MASIDLQKQAQEILDIASKHGVEQNFFFITTFKRYQVQINILNDLEKTIKRDGTLVTKEYVKGRQNVYTHPAITEYNKTANGANQTVQTLMKIITTLRDEGSEDAEELIAFIRGE
jgi:predicted transcriptional regulator